MLRILIKSNSSRNTSFNSFSSSTFFNTHLRNSTTSALISSTSLFNPSSGSYSTLPNPINLAKIQNGYHQGCKFSVLNFQIGFRRFFSSGYLIKLASLRNYGRNGSGFMRVRRTSFLGESRSFCGEPNRESIEYDVVIVGAGPAGLSAAIRLKQLCQEKDVDLSVCVVEKGAEVGAHIISGNVFEPRALDELLPEWKQEESPITVPVSSDKFWYLSKDRAFSLPCPFNNKGNYVISLSQLVRWMGAKAEELGIEIYPGFAASEILYDSNDNVVGIGTNDMGISKDGSKKENFQRGVELKGRITLLAEGCRGSLSEKVLKKYNLREKGHAQHQTYALGIKEVWEIDEAKHKPGYVLHTLGWPLDQKTYGGSFLYHMKDRQVSIGLVVALNYHNPFLNPYEEFQKFKQHPAIKPVLEGGTVLQYGARTLNEGGFQSIPYPVFPGGAIIGCSAGFLNVPKIKGTHTAMKSGMLAAEATFHTLHDGSNMETYLDSLKNSWIWEELYRARNYRPICYQIWRKEFCMYPWSLVRRVKRCWDRLRNWLAVNFPEAGATLRKGATEDDIKELENVLKVKLPLPTRVLYRFVDGQEFKGKDYITSVFGRQLGLIGGYIFYEQCVNVYMLPLRQVIWETREIKRELRVPGKPKYVAVACSSTFTEKFFFLNCSNGQLYVGTQNLPHYGEMIPCVPDELIRSVHDCNGDQQQDATLLWLEEHVRRLESGIIKLREYGNIRCISLFPEETPLCSIAITNGVKVRASAVFVPELANLKNEREKYLFAYSIRMSLLPEGCIINGMSFSSCQLHWRHWIIRANDTVISDIDGEAVIGQFPLLKPGEEEFVYESCTNLTSSTGSVEGSFTFVPGSLVEPRGSSFEVAVARFPLQRPDYIF